jgi:hypothetical protein
MKINAIKMLQLSAAALVLSAFTYGGVAAAEKKKEAAKAPACNTLKDEKGCEARDTCTWVAAVTDAKTGKQKRRAYCRAKPKAPAKKKT